METMPDSGFIQLGSGPGCIHRAKTVLWFWVRLLTLTRSLSNHVNIHAMGGAVASWLVCLSPDRVVRGRALARDIVLCSWERHFTLTLPLSNQVYTVNGNQ